MPRPSSIFSILILLVLPAAAHAQSENSSWGFSTSTVLRWSIPPATIGRLFGDHLSVEGGEMRIGIARGRLLSGDWSINYVRKKIAEGSFVEVDDEFRVAESVVIHGVAIDKFIPFGTIKRRVQIGLTTGAGVGWARGDAVDQRGPIEPSTLLAPFDQELAVVPLVRLELGVAVITLPGLKVRASAGFNYPGLTRLTIGSVYLFGGR